jgi:RimJ/RimL family protein N-acetyltransferase
MGVYAEQLRLDGPDLDHWCELYAAGRALDGGDSQSPAAIAALLRASPETERDYFAARQDGRLIGAASVHATRASEAHMRIYVDIDARRRGAGRALADCVLLWAGGRGFERVTGTTVVGSPGEAFARALGAGVVLRLVTVAADLHGATVTGTVPTPVGLRLLHWRNRTPNHLLDAYARLRRTVGDAPGAELQMDAQSRDAAWVRTWESERTATGDELWVCAALADSTQQLVGFTEAQVPAAGTAQQHDTAVLAGWRGRGVATLLKAEMLAWLRAERPAVETLTSTINERNLAMRHVSTRLGFREIQQRYLVARDIRSKGAR